MNHKTLKDGIDLHIHTTNSDGMRSLEDTIKDAENENMKAIAITDHNTFAITEPMKFNDLEVIPGAEFSTLYKEEGKLTEVHIVGLFFNGVNEEFKNIFNNVYHEKEQYIRAIISKLQELGVNITYEQLKACYKESKHFGRSNIAEFMLKMGYVSSLDEAFDKYIGNYSPYWINPLDFVHYMPTDKCVKLICENNGIPILAHPYHYKFSDEEVERLIKYFKEAAGNNAAAMEVYYKKYDENQRAVLKSLAEKYNLLLSAGSDSHKKTDKFVHEAYNLLLKMKNTLNIH